MKEHQLARGLGWFSIGLGLACILGPRKLSQSIGIKNRESLIQLIGLREITCGIGLLSDERSTPWFRGRVIGDVLDLSLLGAAFTSNRTKKGRATVATALVSGVTALDVYCSRRLDFTSISERRRERRHERRLYRNTVQRSITIDRSPEELFQLWRNLENLPRLMSQLQSVQVISETRSHWVALGPGGQTVEWDAEIIDERPNKRIAWRSVPGSDVEHAGAVEFENAPGNRGTIVRVHLGYTPPGGRLGAAIAKMSGQSPEKQIQVDLLRFKQFIETGEIARTEGQPAARPTSAPPRSDRLVRRMVPA